MIHQHMSQMNLSHDPRNSAQQAPQQAPQQVPPPAVSSMHDVSASHQSHLRHRPPHYSTPTITTNTSNTLRTNLITVPIQETAVVQQPAPIHETLPPQSYYNQYPTTYVAPMAHPVSNLAHTTPTMTPHPAANLVHTIPPPTAQPLAPPVQPMMTPIHNLTIPPPHIATTQPPGAGSYYAAPQTYQTAGYTTPAPQFAAPTAPPQYVPAAAPAPYPPTAQAPPAPQQRIGYEYQPNQQWTNNQQYYR